MAVNRFVNPEWLVEIEVDAVIAELDKKLPSRVCGRQENHGGAKAQNGK